MAVVPAILITLVYSAILGLIFYVAIYRPLRNAPALARVGASIGVMLALQAIALLNYSTFAVSSPPILPDTPMHFAGLVVPSDRLYLAGLTVLVGLVLAAIYRFTRFGLVTRAAVGNERGAALLGHSATRIAAYNWVLATVLAAAAGILILPITTLNPGTYTLFIVPALGAALLGRFSSFASVVVAGLVIGMLQSELVKLQAVWTWLPQKGLQDGLPFIIIMLAIVVLARRLSARGAITDVHNPVVGRPGARRSPPAAASWSASIALLVAQRRLPLGDHLLAGHGLHLLLGGDHHRLRRSDLAGPERARRDQRVHGHPHRPEPRDRVPVRADPGRAVRGRRRRRHRAAGSPGPRRQPGGDDARHRRRTRRARVQQQVVQRRIHGPQRRTRHISSGSTWSRPPAASRSGSWSSWSSALMGLFVARVRNGRLGRTFLAVRSNERAAASIGIDVARAKLLAFAIAAFVAGIGGGLLAYQQQNINAATFTLWTSLTILAITYVGGVGRITGALAAGALLASNGAGPDGAQQPVQLRPVPGADRRRGADAHRGGQPRRHDQGDGRRADQAAVAVIWDASPGSVAAAPARRPGRRPAPPPPPKVAGR